MSSEDPIPSSQHSSPPRSSGATSLSMSSPAGSPAVTVTSTQAIEFMTAEPMTPEPMTLEPMTLEPMTPEPMTLEPMTMTAEPMTPEPMTLEHLPGKLPEKTTEMPPAENQIAQSIEQLSAGDFHSRWDYAKQLSQQFSQWGDRVIPPLIHHLKTQPDPDTQWFLVRILSQFEHPDVVTALAELLVTTQSEDLQIEVSKALSTLGGSAIKTLSDLLMTSDLTPDLAPEMTSHLARPSTLDSPRILAARALAYIRRGAVIGPLLTIVEDPNPELRAIAVEALGSFHDARITPVLLAALKDRPTICIEAIRALGRRSDLLATTDLITPLQQCLCAEDESVACESAIALGRLGTDAAVTALGQQLVSPLSSAVKTAIVRALGWLDVASSVDYLVNAFQVSVPVIMPAVKKDIAQALGQTRQAELQAIAAAPLIEWLKDSQLTHSSKGASDGLSRSSQDGDVAPPNVAPPNVASSLETVSLLRTVLSSLARLSAAESLDSLIPILSNPDPRIRMHALNALKQIDPSAAQARAQSYLQGLDSSPVKKQYVIEVLAAW